MHQHIGAKIHLFFVMPKVTKNPLAEPRLSIRRIVRQANVQFDALCVSRQDNLAGVGINWGIR